MRIFFGFVVLLFLCTAADYRPSPDHPTDPIARKTIHITADTVAPAEKRAKKDKKVRKAKKKDRKAKKKKARKSLPASDTVKWSETYFTADTVALDSLPVLDTLAVVEEALPIRKDTLVIIGVGDIMMGTNYPDDSRLPPEDGAFLMRSVEEYLKDADLTFGNLEGVLLDSGGTVKQCKDPKVCYAFRSPVSYVENLTRAGFDIMSLANNHAGDFGDEGRQSTMRALDSAGIAHAGQLTHPYVIYIRDSITYGFTAFAPNSGCVPLNDIKNAQSIIAHLDSVADVVIVSGCTTPARSARKGSLLWRRSWGRLCIGAGMD